jgi:hypothetical protein
MTGDFSDRDFADQAVKHLPLAAPSPGFEAALLAAYDAWNGARANGPWAAWMAGWRRFSETVWPGAPLWAPATALAAALLAGAGLGAALPAVMNREPPGFSLERTASFDLLSSDLLKEDL